MATITVNVEIPGKKAKEVEVDLDFDNLTLRESVIVEEAIGAETFDKIISTGEIPPRPTIIQAVLLAKLSSKFPGIEAGQFDIDLSTLQEVGEDGQGNG